jgi:hypothetical protein
MSTAVEVLELLLDSLILQSYKKRPTNNQQINAHIR